MELLTQGIKLPPMSSPMSLTWNRYMMLERNRRLSLAKLITQSIVSASDKGNIQDINKFLTKYIDAEIRTSDVYENTDILLMEEYSKVKQLKATAEVDRDGNLVVKGVLDGLGLGKSDGVQR